MLGTFYIKQEITTNYIKGIESISIIIKKTENLDLKFIWKSKAVTGRCVELMYAFVKEVHEKN